MCDFEREKMKITKSKVPSINLLTHSRGQVQMT